MCVFFFFQAEDGIRDFHVTGVQTCALPISIRLEQPVEPGTGIQKAMVVTLDASGTGVTVRHTLTNRGQKPFELAPWALTVMNPGGTAIIPQEPYASHDTA